MHIHESDFPLLGAYAAWPLPFVRGEADQVFTADGKAYWDFYGGHCVAGTGHAHPAVVAAVSRQAGELLFYSTAARIPVREQAAAALLAVAPPGMGGVFFCNSGAEANESALKLAVQLTGRKTIVAFDGAFHGRTLFALAATDNAALHAPLAGVLPAVTRLPFGDGAALDAADFGHAAAVILEPVQSMAGVRMADPGWYRALAAKAKAAGALLILDEVQTGMGRLGAMFGAERFGIAPDMITLAKGIASGVPMGALLVSADIAARVPGNALGSTFGGAPLACAALLATLQVIQQDKLAAHAAACEMLLRQGLRGGVVGEVRGAGLLLGLHAGAKAGALRQHLFERRILVGGSNDPAVLRLMPPLNVSATAIQALLAAVREFDAAQAAA